MSLQDEELYPKYLIWLESKKNTVGGLELSKISRSLFDEFTSRYENNPDFKEKVDNQYRSIDREDKIGEIIKDDFEIFMEEMGKEVKVENKIDKDFFDF
jgi:hypothetical protein